MKLERRAGDLARLFFRARQREDLKSLTPAEIRDRTTLAVAYCLRLKQKCVFGLIGATTDARPFEARWAMGFFRDRAVSQGFINP